MSFKPYQVRRSYDIAVGVTSTAGTTTSDAMCRHVLITSDVGCYVAWAPSAPTAAAPGSTAALNVVRVGIYKPIILTVPPSSLFAAIEDHSATAGVVTISELDG